MEKKVKKTRKVTSPEVKLLKEAKLTNKLLYKLIDIQDNIWNERKP